MTFRRTIAVLFAGCAIFSPGANAFWFFQHRPAPVIRLSHAHYHRSYRHHRHYHAHSRHGRTYRRVITEYRIYYVPAPYPSAPRPQRKSPAPGLKDGVSPSVAAPGTPSPVPPATAAAPASRPAAPVAAARPSGPPAPVAAAPASQPPASSKPPIAHADPVPGRPSALAAVQAGTLATANSAHREAPISVHQTAPAGGAMTSTPAARPVTAAARPQQVAAASPLAQKAPGGIAPQPSRSTGMLRAPQASSSLAFLAPLVAALAALSGLGYAVFRKRKRPLPGTTRHVGAAPSQPDSPVMPETAGSSNTPPVTPAAAGSPSTPPAATARRGFNFDEVRRVNVGRVFMAPLPQATVGTGGAAAVETTNGGGNIEAGGHPPADGKPPANAGKVVQHAYGDAVQGVIDEIYDTPEAKARMDGFYEHIPAEFQDLTWMKVTYHQGQIYTFAAAMPGLVIHPGDTVRLVFGQQDPPVPNQVVAVVHLQSPSSGVDAGIMDGPA